MSVRGVLLSLAALSGALALWVGSPEPPSRKDLPPSVVPMPTAPPGAARQPRTLSPKGKKRSC